MADQTPIGGIIFLKIDGTRYSAKGAWSYNLGRAKKEFVIGADAVHGYKTLPQIAFVEGAITDRSDIDLAALVDATDITVTLELANGKTVVLHHALQAGDGTGNTEEGEIALRFEGEYAEEIAA